LSNQVDSLLINLQLQTQPEQKLPLSIQPNSNSATYKQQQIKNDNTLIVSSRNMNDSTNQAIFPVENVNDSIEDLSSENVLKKRSKKKRKEKLTESANQPDDDGLFDSLDQKSYNILNSDINSTANNIIDINLNYNSSFENLIPNQTVNKYNIYTNPQRRIYKKNKFTNEEHGNSLYNSVPGSSMQGLSNGS
jgi:hypothetical protein